jgi:hypothetical protein
MSDMVKATIILAAGLVIAAILHGGVYQAIGGDQAVGFRVNRFTGGVVLLKGFEMIDVKYGKSPYEESSSENQPEKKREFLVICPKEEAETKSQY